MTLFVLLAVCYVILDNREKGIAAGYGQEYVREEYGRQDKLAVIGRCHPMFGSGMHEITLRDTEQNHYYVYVMVGRQGSLIRVEDATRDVRRGRSQFGCGLNREEGTVTPDILQISPDQVVRVQYGEANNSSDPVVFDAKTAAGRAVIEKVIEWYDDAEYEGPAPDSQLQIRTMGYPSLRLFIRGDEDSVFVNLVDRKLNVMHPSLEEPLSIASDELEEWMLTGWKKDR